MTVETSIFDVNMTVETKPIRVICPTCGKEAKIEIPIFIVQDQQDGVANIQVPHGACCREHSFMAIIDRHFKVRGYQKPDIEFIFGEKQKTAEQKKMEGLKGYSVTDMVDTIGPDICARILRGILAGTTILLLDTFDLYDRVDKTVVLLRDMCADELACTIEKTSKDSLEDKKSPSYNALVVVPMYRAIKRTPFQDTISTRFENYLLRNALQIPDRTSQIVFLRKELVKIKKIIDDFVKVLKNMDKIYEEDIPTYIQSKFNYILDVKNIDVIKQVIWFKYDKKLAQKIISKYADILM